MWCDIGMMEQAALWIYANQPAHPLWHMTFAMVTQFQL